MRVDPFEVRQHDLSIEPMAMLDLGMPQHGVGDEVRVGPVDFTAATGAGLHELHRGMSPAADPLTTRSLSAPVGRDTSGDVRFLRRHACVLSAAYAGTRYAAP
jgi:hypothetical protein